MLSSVGRACPERAACADEGRPEPALTLNEVRGNGKQPVYDWMITCLRSY